MIESAVAQTLTSETLFDAIGRLLGFSLLAGGTSLGVAFIYRWYSTDDIPEGVAILCGVSMVAIWLNTKTALQDAIIGETPLLDPETAVYTVAVFAVSAIAADGGRRLGTHLAQDVFSMTAPQTITDVSELVRSAGRVVTIELPAEIADVDGYDSVPAETKTELAGQTVLLPRRLSEEHRRERLIDRLERDYGIGHVDLEFAADGTVAYLAVGSRPAGIGPTLAPGSVAVAICADPAPDASPGDAVRIWRSDVEPARRVASGELRGVADDVATVAIDAADVEAIDREATERLSSTNGDGGPDTDGDGPSYRLVTLPRDADAERELVSLLRAADETVTALSVAAGDALEGATVGSLPVLVIALERDDTASGDQLALPDDDVRFEAGDVAYVLGRPDALRRVTELEREMPQSTAAHSRER